MASTSTERRMRRLRAVTNVVVMVRGRLVEVVEVLLVALLAGTALVQVWRADSELAGGAAVHSVLVAGFCLPLLARRRYPVAALGVVAVAAWLQFELGGGLGQPFFVVLVALYAVGAYAAWPRTLLAPALVLLLVSTDLPRLVAGEPVEDVVPAWFILAGSWALGWWIRRRRADAVALSERASQAEQDAAIRAELAVTEERARIARELHDLVAHSMGVIVIQAQAAQRSLASDPAAAQTALAAIETTGRDGLGEMRRLLALLTEPDDASTAPQPGLDQVGELVESVRAAGLPVSLVVEGEPAAVPPGVGLAAYRIVQEALTNVLKHAGQAAATVVLRHRGGGLEVEVTDTGRGPVPTAGPSRGHGLVGMRQRVGLYGGSVETSAAAGGGFRVLAWLPAPPP